MWAKLQSTTVTIVELTKPTCPPWQTPALSHGQCALHYMYFPMSTRNLPNHIASNSYMYKLHLPTCPTAMVKLRQPWTMRSLPLRNPMTFIWFFLTSEIQLPKGPSSHHQKLIGRCTHSQRTSSNLHLQIL